MDACFLKLNDVTKMGEKINFIKRVKGVCIPADVDEDGVRVHLLVCLLIKEVGGLGGQVTTQDDKP